MTDKPEPAVAEVTLPRCKCGRTAKYAGDGRCEACFERACQKWNGKDRSVNTLIRTK